MVSLFGKARAAGTSARDDDAQVWSRFAELPGAVGIKIRQHLALRPDLIVDEARRRAYLELTDRGAREALDWHTEVRPIVERALAPDQQHRLVWVDPSPAGVASLAQVHRGRLDDGRSVAIKVLRPGIEAEVAQGIAALREVARELEHQHALPTRSAEELVGEIQEWLARELDLRHEADNLQRFREMLAGSAIVCVPRVYDELGTARPERAQADPPRPGDEVAAPRGARVLMLEFLDGVSFSDLLRWIASGRDTVLRARGLDREALARNLLEAMLEQVFLHRHFHADTHPGNLLALPGNRIGFVDFGLVDVIDPRFGRRIHRYLSAIYTDDVDSMLLGLKGVLLPTEDASWVTFQERFFDVHRAYRRGGASDGGSSSGRYISAVLSAARTSGYRIPVGILSMLRALYAADYIAHQLAPDVDLARVGAGFLARNQWRLVAGLLQPDELQGELFHTVDMLRDGTRSGYRLLSALADEQLTVRVENVESPQTRRLADARAQLISLSLAAVGVCVVLAAILAGWAAQPPLLLAALCALPAVGLGGLLWGIARTWARLSRR